MHIWTVILFAPVMASAAIDRYVDLQTLLAHFGIAELNGYKTGYCRVI
jgi:hypothetical protein